MSALEGVAPQSGFESLVNSLGSFICFEIGENATTLLSDPNKDFMGHKTWSASLEGWNLIHPQADISGSASQDLTEW